MDKTVHHHQISTLDEFNPHLLGQKSVLKVGRIVHTRRQHHHRGRRHTVWSEILQHFEQTAGIIVHRTHARGFKDLRKRAFEHLAVFQDVRHAGWTAQVILEDIDLPIAVAHQIRPSDVAPDTPWRLQAYTWL